MEEAISQLHPGDVIDARVTHLENFGVFADIGCGIVALLPIDSISVSRIDHPRERFSVGMDIRVVIKSIENGRITLSQKELLGSWEQGIKPGQQASVYIKNIIPSRMKIKLVIIDTFDYEYHPATPKYFFSGDHMERFVYSPPCSEKEVITEFAQT